MNTAFAWEKIILQYKPQGLTYQILAPSKGTAEEVFITCEGEVRYRLDGEAPTAEDGHLLHNDGFLVLHGELEIKKFKAINVGDAFSVLQCSYKRN